MDEPDELDEFDDANVIYRSLWLPVARVNFFSVMTDPDLILWDDDDVTTRTRTRKCQADRFDKRPGYIPHLRESVMRRLVEVLPRSFGYNKVGVCGLSDEWDERNRPVSLTMTLHPNSAAVGVPEARAANAALCDAGVRTVRLHVSENGYYAFAATYARGADSNGDAASNGAASRVGRALESHILAVFGGDFTVERLTPDRRTNEGRAALRRYNGLAPDATDKGEATVVSPPRGALSFYQLNIMVEGLCNQTLLPAVFFEHYKEAQEWFDKNPLNTSMITSISRLLAVIIIPENAAVMSGQTAALRRFLVVSRGSLAWMRRAVESVRRSLLDQMMAVSHRRARLIQLDLAGIGYERTPEMTGVATESQMRGYVMLVATKIPLITNVAEGAVRAGESLRGEVAADPGLATQFGARVDELGVVVETWNAVLESLHSYVNTLETAVEHDWQERLLFEQEQARSDQEAIAEIERSRRGRPETRRVGDVAHNAAMLFLTAVAVFFAVRAGDEWLKQGNNLWWVSGFAVVLMLAWLSWQAIWRLVKQRKPNNDSYSFEFAFRLDEVTDPELVHKYLTQPQRRHPSETFKQIRLRRLGGWRIERVSPDTTMRKVHSVATVRVSRLRYARFEIVNEIMIRRTSTSSQYFLRQCRMFGDSPRALSPQQLDALVKEILRLACLPLAPDLKIDDITSL